MANKKIVIVGPAWPLRGGLATYNERLCIQFNEEHFDCNILSFSLQYPNILFPGKTQYSNEPAPESIQIDTAINSINPINWIKVGLKYKKMAPDVMVFRYWMPFMAPCLGTIARMVRKNKKTKLVAIADNIYPHEKHFYDKLFTSYFIRSMDKFITMSHAVLADIKKLAPHKNSQFVPHPMYDNFGKLLPKSESKSALQLDPSFHYILFFGFIRAYKGLALLIKAFSDERLRKLPIKLLIAGEFYEDSQAYLTLIESLNLKENIVLHTHFIDNKDVCKYFSACDIVAQTYLNATQSGVTQIAYHFNKPMLVTNVGGLAETVPNKEVGYVVNVNEKEIADALLDFYQNNREIEMSENAASFKKRFSWETVTKTIVEI